MVIVKRYFATLGSFILQLGGRGNYGCFDVVDFKQLTERNYRIRVVLQTCG